MTTEESKRSIAWAKANPEKVKASRKAFYQRHKDRIKAEQKKYRDANKEKTRQRNKEYREEHKEELNKKSKQWYQDNIEHVKEYRKKNKQHTADCERKRLRNNIQRRLSSNLRRRVRAAINGDCKSTSTTALLGCSIDEFKKHLESLFKEGMSWDNYGRYGWHIDHIIPCNSFNLEHLEDQKKCFHYSNMQPLWAKENHSKWCN